MIVTLCEMNYFVHFCCTCFPSYEQIMVEYFLTSQIRFHVRRVEEYNRIQFLLYFKAYLLMLAIILTEAKGSVSLKLKKNKTMLW